ncbi:Eco57I restriction endonuclease [Halobacteroides halobius DSM 5150]|uniref:site-specific DNA-methyltransferase (adenine-specific) n=1 Tax=Halobacteroides halobius (strain ATCC 35273 / DSM 5150 / MD-1) TaxID=748449 RepID=L0K7K0_HALHC|nr:DNA methyltransferase [Halobacteroides halobius]AGB40991.1 Eco57I restriction endonuclease [Halobacteroides halobius DSM 5150]
MDLESIYNSKFNQNQLLQLISHWGGELKKETERLEIPLKYQEQVVSYQQIAIYNDLNQYKLPIIRMKLKNYDVEIMRQLLVELEFEQVIVASHYQQRKWQLSFVDLRFQSPRIYSWVLGAKKSSYSFKQLVGGLSNSPSLAKIRQAFNPQSIIDQFLIDCKGLISILEEELDGQVDKAFKLARKVLLQILIFNFLQLISQDNFADKLSLDLKGPIISNSLLAEINPEFSLSNQIHQEITTVLGKYNFILKTNTPYQQQLSLTPQILADFFERLVKSSDRKRTGVFYTPQEIVYYICQESILNYLVTELEIEISQKELQNLVYKNEVSPKIKEYSLQVDQLLSQIKICDPAVGSGAFVIGMLEELVRLRQLLTEQKTSYQLKLETIKNSLYGVDLDGPAIEITKLRVWFCLLAESKDNQLVEPLSTLRYKFVEGNSLLTRENNLFNLAGNKLKRLKKDYYQTNDRAQRRRLAQEIDSLLQELLGETFSFHFYFSEVFTKQAGFDLIIGNPPYVGEKGNKELFRKIKEYALNKYYTGKMDLFYFFFHLGLDLTKHRGHLALITTNYYLRATSADKLRADLKERSTIKQLINFNELKLFPTAMGQHNLITILMKGSEDIPAQTTVTYRQGIADIKTISKILSGVDNKTNYYSVLQRLLYEGENNYLRLEIGDLETILTKVKEQGVRLDQVCNINQGIVTGCDRISNRHLKRYDLDLPAGRGVFVLAKQEVESLDYNQETNFFLKSWFKNSDINKWLPELESDDYLLYLNHNLDDIPKKIKSYLTPAQIVLQERREVKRGLINWWQLQWPREERIFVGPKIVAPQRSKRNVFAYTEEAWYASADVYFITQFKNKINLKYILALLNSDLYYLWLYRKGKKKGNLLELYQGPLAEVPIKLISPTKQQPFIKAAELMIEKQKELTHLKAITWQDLLPPFIKQTSLAQLSSQLKPLYQGQAHKVRQIKIEINNKKVTIFSAKAKKGWYQVLEFEAKTIYLANYIKYHLENLLIADLEKINTTLEGGLVDKVKQIKLPQYTREQIERLVKEWITLEQKIEELKNDLQSGQEKINRLVYNLYGLNEEEIKVINKKREELK